MKKRTFVSLYTEVNLFHTENTEKLMFHVKLHILFYLYYVAQLLNN